MMKISTEADNVRAVFQSHRDEKNPVVIASLLAKAEEELHIKRHPDPYIRACLMAYSCGTHISR